MKGQLNIGATYGEGGIFDYFKKEGAETIRNDTVNLGTKTDKKTVEPKVNMKSR